MQQLSDLDPDKNMKVLLFGESGCGKTCLASTFPGPIHYADFDLKVSSVAAFHKGTARIAEITYDQYPGLRDALGTAGELFNYDMGEARKATDFPYRTLVIDSLTTLSDRMMEYLIKQNPGIKRTMTKGVIVPALQDYGLFRVFMKQLIGEILSFPCNVIFTAHIDTKKDEHTGAIVRQPMLTGKLASELPIYFEEVYMAYVEGEGSSRKYMLQTSADRKFNCRSQRGLPAKIESSYENILKLSK